jgi:hypothetical protein
MPHGPLPLPVYCAVCGVASQPALERWAPRRRLAWPYLTQITVARHAGALATIDALLCVRIDNGRKWPGGSQPAIDCCGQVVGLSEPVPRWRNRSMPAAILTVRRRDRGAESLKSRWGQQTIALSTTATRSALSTRGCTRHAQRLRTQEPGSHLEVRQRHGSVVCRVHNGCR